MTVSSISFSGANGPCCVTTLQVVPIFPRPVTSLNQLLPCVADRLGYEPISGTCTHGRSPPAVKSAWTERFFDFVDHWGVFFWGNVSPRVSLVVDPGTSCTKQSNANQVKLPLRCSLQGLFFCFYIIKKRYRDSAGLVQARNKHPTTSAENPRRNE
jgi:hypothetical protein